MPGFSPCTTSRRSRAQRGGVLLAALVVTLLSATLVVGVAYEAGLRMATTHRQSDANLALIYAQAGIECAARQAPKLGTWRQPSMPGTLLNELPIGEGKVTVTISDPADGLVEVDGGSVSSSADTVLFTATATVGGVTRTLTAKYVPLPHEVLTFVAFSNEDLTLQDVTLEGRLRSNRDVKDNGGVDVFGDITTIDGKTIDATLNDDDTNTGTVPDLLSAPALDVSWFRDAGARVTPTGTPLQVNGKVIDNTYNPLGPISSDGIYYIEAAGKDIYIRNCIINASIAVLNANHVYIGGDWANNAGPIYFRSADPGRLPALVVQGKLVMQVEAGAFTAARGFSLIGGSSGLEGVFYATDDIQGPQVWATTPITVTGAIMSAKKMDLVGPRSTIRHDENLNQNPLAELAIAELRHVPGSTQEL